MYKRSLGEYHPEIIFTLNKLGETYCERQLYKEVMNFTKYNSLNLQLNNKPEKNWPCVISTLIKVANLHKLQGDMEMALNFFVDALDIQRGNCSSKEDRLELANFLYNVGH